MSAKTLLIILAVSAQILFSAGDLTGRYFMRKGGFNLQNFISWWFLAYMTSRQIATFMQLYIMATMNVGKTMALFGAVSIILSNTLGFLLLGELVTVPVFIGASLAAAAFIVLALF